MRSLRSLPSTGAVSSSTHVQAKARLLAALPDVETAQVSTAFIPQRARYATWVIQSFLYKPVVAGASAFVFLVGGWMTTVSAAADSLPGDTLYNFKLINERAQLQLASLDRRAVLHTEFAERRLEEVQALQEKTVHVPERTTLIANTVVAYQQELQSAASDLRALQEINNEQAILVASDVREHIDNLEVTLDANEAENQQQEDQVVVDVVDEAQIISQEVQQVATDVLVTVHEESPSSISEREMQEIFRRDLGDVQSRITVDLHRIERLETILAQEKIFLAQLGVTIPEQSEIADMKRKISVFDDKIPAIMSDFARGGYRHALDELHVMKNDFRLLDALLTDVEFRITEALTQKPIEPELSIE